MTLAFRVIFFWLFCIFFSSFVFALGPKLGSYNAGVANWSTVHIQVDCTDPQHATPFSLSPTKTIQFNCNPGSKIQIFRNGHIERTVGLGCWDVSGLGSIWGVNKGIDCSGHY